MPVIVSLDKFFVAFVLNSFIFGYSSLLTDSQLMPFFAPIKLLIAISLLTIWGTWATAQAPDFQPLQPDKVEWADQVGRHAKVRKDSNLLAEYHYLYGKIYQASGNYLMSKKHYLHSLCIQEARGYAWGLVRLYGQLTSVEQLQVNHTQSLRYAMMGLKIAEQSNLDQARLHAYGVLIFLYSERAASDTLIELNTPHPYHDSAVYYLSKAEPIARRIGKPFDLMTLDMQFGHEMLRMKDRRALAYYQEALDIGSEIQKPFEQVKLMLTMAYTHLFFGEPNIALGFLKRAEKLNSTMPHQNRSILRDVVYNYARYYQATGNWKAALEYTQKLHEMQKQEYLADRDGAVTRLSMEYENEKKEAQLTSQQKELTLQNKNLQTQQWLLYALSALLLLAVGAIAVYYRLFRQKERISRQNAELVQEQNHRVKNNLQLVSGLLQLQANRLSDEAAIRAVEDTQSRIEVMAVLQRKLYDTDQLSTMRAQEFIQDVVSNCLQTFGCIDVDTTFTIPPTLELSPDHAMRVGLIVNELTTNACKYAFPNHPNPSLRIKVWQEDTALHLWLADNGPGFTDSLAITEGRQSLGMKIIQLQVAQLYGKYRFDTSHGTSFQMQFTSEPTHGVRTSFFSPSPTTV